MQLTPQESAVKDKDTLEGPAPAHPAHTPALILTLTLTLTLHRTGGGRQSGRGCAFSHPGGWAAASAGQWASALMVGLATETHQGLSPGDARVKRGEAQQTSRLPWV